MYKHTGEIKASSLIPAVKGRIMDLGMQLHEFVEKNRDHILEIEAKRVNPYDYDGTHYIEIRALEDDRKDREWMRAQIESLNHDIKTESALLAALEENPDGKVEIGWNHSIRLEKAS